MVNFVSSTNNNIMEINQKISILLNELGKLLSICTSKLWIKKYDDSRGRYTTD